MHGGSVVVVGTGGAGLRAALELQRAGNQVLVVSKGAAGASGATPSALFSYCSASPSDPSNSVELFREDVLRSGLTVNDPLLVELMCRDGYRRMEDLDRLGMSWARSSSGEFALSWLPGHSVARAFYVDRRTGKALSMTLLRACLRAGVRFVQYHAVLDLLVDGGKAAGLVLLDWVRGEAVVWRCDGVIIASGGTPGIYRLHTNPPGQTGDGMAAILRAGGELVDMEFMQMYPTVLVHPPAAYGMEIATGHLMAAGARLFNRKGEEFFNRWEKGPVGQATRDVLARAIAREISAGGGTDAGGVYLDARNLPEVMEPDRYVRFLRDLGVNLTHAPQQVAPGAHFSLGGIRVNPPTSCWGVSGAFAAGEVMGGVQGANRLAGNALTETQVFGALAGQEALESLRRISNVRTGRKEQSETSLPESRRPQRGESWVWDALCDARARSAGRQIGELATALRDTVQQYASMIRTGPGLEQALTHIENLRRAFYRELVLPVRPEQWQPELLEAVEMANMLEVAPSLVASAFVRTESRGAHFRDDYPERDRKFDGHNLVVRGTGEKMAVFRLDRGRNERRQVWP